jgi:LmbE family N-acetylglucosaminyl deacetylase
VPFRLLGVFPRLADAISLSGGTLARCADSGIETMVVSLTSRDRSPDGVARTARILGLSHLVHLDFGEVFDAEEGDSMREAINDLMRSFQPDVVVAAGAVDGGTEAVQAAIRAAVQQAWRAGSGPARLYWSTRPADLVCTTVIDVRPQFQRKLDAQSLYPGEPAAAYTSSSADQGAKVPDRELFVRFHPRPWVTGIIERDLFAGLWQRSASVLSAAA